MTRNSSLVLVTAFTLVLIASCSRYDRSDSPFVSPGDYRDIQSTPELVVPDHMDPLDIEDAWVIPNIEERPLPQTFPNEAPRPVPIVGDANPDLIRIQKLGQRGWMVVQRKPETVWPVILQWLQDQGIESRIEKINEGLVFTQVIEYENPGPESVINQIETAKSTVNLSNGKDWIAMKLENGIRQDSSEVHIRFINSAELIDESELEWPEQSTHFEIEEKILETLARYDAAKYGGIISERIRQINLPAKAEIQTDGEGYPFLHLNIDFQRSWATIQRALNNADFEVSVDESSSKDGYFVVQVSDEILNERKRNWFVRIITLRPGGDRANPTTIHINVLKSGDGHDVTLTSIDEDKELTIEFVQEILRILREFAV